MYMNKNYLHVPRYVNDGNSNLTFISVAISLVRNQSDEIEILNTVDQTRLQLHHPRWKAPIREQRNDCGETEI